MNCPTCEAEMQPLLINYYCPSCELSGREPTPPVKTRAYIVFRGRPPGSCEYVFRTEDDAVLWRLAAGLSKFPVRIIEANGTLTWRKSTGSVPDIVLADRLFEIYMEHDTRMLEPNQARLVPEPKA